MLSIYSSSYGELLSQNMAVAAAMASPTHARLSSFSLDLLFFTACIWSLSLQVRALFTEQTEGPYWVDEGLNRSNIKGNLTQGLPLNLTLQVVDRATKSAVQRAKVDVWHCNYEGVYSDEKVEGSVGLKWLRGYQLTNESGYAAFYTIYPGFYTGRTVHIHVRVRVYGVDGAVSYDDTTQLYFDDAINDGVFRHVHPYNARRSNRLSTNQNDGLFSATNLVQLTGTYDGNLGYRTANAVALSLPFPAQLPR